MRIAAKDEHKDVNEIMARSKGTPTTVETLRRSMGYETVRAKQT